MQTALLGMDRLEARNPAWGKCNLTDTESVWPPMCWASAPTLPLCCCLWPHRDHTSMVAVLVSLSLAGIGLWWADWGLEVPGNLSLSRALFQECYFHTQPLHGQLLSLLQVSRAFFSESPNMPTLCKISTCLPSQKLQPPSP